jgi:phosphatidylglycerophosphate synthase
VAHVVAGDAPEVVVALGDRVWVPAVLGALREPLAEGADVRLPVSGTGEAEPSGLARTRLAHLDRLPLAAGLGEADVRAALGQTAGIETRAVGLQWRSVRTGDDLPPAETLLLRALVKPADGVVSRRLNRRISTSITRRLVRLPLEPNHVTAVVFAIGVLSGPFAGAGTYLGFALGGFCYWFSAVLDGCDGEISRLKYLGSPLGAWLDTVVDDLVGLSWLLGMYWGLHRGAAHPWWLWIGAGAIGCFLLTIGPRYWLFATRVGAGDHQQLAARTRPRDSGLVARVGLFFRDVVFRTDFLPFAGMVTAACGVVQVFAAAFAAGSIAGVIDTVVTLVRVRRAGGKPGGNHR